MAPTLPPVDKPPPMSSAAEEAVVSTTAYVPSEGGWAETLVKVKAAALQMREANPLKEVRTTREAAVILASLGAEAKKRLHRYFVHYGPPYNAEYGGDLPEECHHANVSLVEVHYLLNDGADPRVGNAADYYNTPMHYAARYHKLKLAKMLLRAGASPNQRNELGMNALTTAAIFNGPETRRKHHLKLCEWLVDHGADVNNVDNGGHTPLELASSWGNLVLVTALLARGARVHRDVQLLSIPSASPVDVAATAEVKALLLAAERREVAEVAGRREDARRRAAAEERHRSTLESIEKRRASRMEQRQTVVLARHQHVRADVASKLAEDQDDHKRRSTTATTAAGVWRKRGPHHWHLHTGISADDAERQSAVDEARAILEDAQGCGHREMLQRRWRSMTGLSLTDAHPVMWGKDKVDVIDDDDRRG